MELRGALESTDVAEINAKTEALSEASRTLADAVYAQASAQAQSQAAGAQAGGDGAASSEDEVIEEADYEVVDEEEAKTS
jgi:molecular chaperone DnaK